MSLSDKEKEAVAILIPLGVKIVMRIETAINLQSRLNGLIGELSVEQLQSLAAVLTPKQMKTLSHLIGGVEVVGAE